MTSTVMWHNRRGQATWEAALLIIVVAAAMITTAVFAKQAVSGRLKDATQGVSDAHYIYGRTSGTQNVTIDLQQRQRVISGEDCETDPDCEASGNIVTTGLIDGAAPYAYSGAEVRAPDFNVYVESESTETTTSSSNFRVNE